MNIIAKKLMGGGNNLSFLLAVVIIVLCSAQMAQAATKKGWKGSGDCYWTTDGNWADISATADGYFLRNGEGESLDATKRTILFNEGTSISIKVSVEKAGTSTSVPYVFLADSDDCGLTTSGNFDVGTYKVGHLAIQRGTFKCKQLNVGGVEGTGTGDLLVIGGSSSKATVTATGKFSINKETVQVKENGRLICQNWAAAGNTDNYTGTLVIDGGEVQSTANYLTIGDTANATGYVYVKNGGKYSNTGSHSNGLCVGQKNVGTLDVDNGTVDIGTKNLMLCDNTNGKATVNVKNGGVVTIGGVTYKDGEGGATITLNGGTIKAAKDNGAFIPSKDKLAMNVGAGGGTIDTNGKNITIAKEITGTGRLFITGGGTVTFTAAPTCKILVASGTTISASASIAETILSNGLEFVGAPILNKGYMVLTSTEDLSGLSLSNVTCGVASAFMPTFGDGNTSIIVTVTSLKSGYWIGAAGDNNLSSEDNWSDGQVPTSGNATIMCPSTATLEMKKDATFAPSSITFAADSAKVTIAGEGALLGIAAITNLSSSANHEFKVAVTGKTNNEKNEKVYFNTATYCVFSGGITVEYADFSQSPSSTAGRTIAGTWNITTNDRWMPIEYNEVKGGATLTVNKLYNPNHLVIQSGATVNAVTVETYQSGATITYRNNGTLEAERYVATGYGSYFSRKPTEDTGGVLKFKSVVDGTDLDIVVNCPTILVGSEGFSFQKRANGRNPGHFRLGEAGKTTVVLPMANYAFKPGFDDSVNYYGIKGTVKIGTKDYNSDEAREVAVNGMFKSDGCIEVMGNGMLVFNSASTFTGGLTISDTATVKVNANCTPGIGAITLCAGTTLALTAVGREFVPLANTLTLPTTGAATIRIDGARLRSGNHEIAAVASGETANVALASNSTVLAGRRASLTIVEKEDGSKTLTLNIKPVGTLIIVR